MRTRVLNSILYKAITDLLSSPEVNYEVYSYSVDISRVGITVPVCLQSCHNSLSLIVMFGWTMTALITCRSGTRLGSTSAWTEIFNDILVMQGSFIKLVLVLCTFYPSQHCMEGAKMQSPSILSFSNIARVSHQVSLPADFSSCRVYWKTSGVSERDDQIQQALDKSSPRIR
jgi:hypothetical protein